VEGFSWSKPTETFAAVHAKEQKIRFAAQG
jgi:hypothetical protein